MTDKEKLVGLLDVIIQPGQKTLGDIADYLLANGVIFPKHAHWTINGDWAECSSCHEASKISVKHNDYCSACGARMDEESVVVLP